MTSTIIKCTNELSFLLALTLSACGSANSGGSNSDAAGGATCPIPCDPALQYCAANGTCVDKGACAVDQDCGNGMKCDPATKQCVVSGCGGQLLGVTNVPPNLLLVLDRSCSMRENLAGTQTSKWQAAVEAIKTVSTTYENDIRWGLTMFPDTDGAACAQDGPIPYPIADNNAPAIRTALTASLAVADPNYPDGPCVTNIDTGIEKAGTDPALNDTTRENYLMLVSDGAQSQCNLAGSDNGTRTLIADYKNLRSIPTYVVGFGSGVDVPALNSFATAGGTARSGATKYYQADNASQLTDAFSQIAKEVVSCQYTLNPAPADINLAFVYFNNTESVPRDTAHTMGWDYDATTMQLTLYGSYCTRVKSRSVTDVDVVYGCDVPPIP
jgi:hypothetical protein